MTKTIETIADSFIQLDSFFDKIEFCNKMI